METVNTNVTAADEFIWVDSHNRLVELQHPPWSQHCILRVIRGGRCSQHSERISTEAVPRLGYLLQRALVRIAREVQRLSSGIGLCSKHEGKIKIICFDFIFNNLRFFIYMKFLAHLKLYFVQH